MHGFFGARLKVAVIGTGISGMSAAWLLSDRHDVTVYERADRIGGHSNTIEAAVDASTVSVDTGFIVYNELAYPNLTALFQHLEVPTEPSDMSFAVSLNGGRLEYSGTNLSGLFAQKRNMLRPRFWSMLNGLHRFYREAPSDVAQLDELHTSLGDYLKSRAYSDAFRDDHLLPMAGAIWSAPPQALLDYPAASFIRFHDNHGLLTVNNRPQWRTVSGGSRSYVAKLTARYRDRIRLSTGAASIRRDDDGVEIRGDDGRIERFDRVLIAAHADEALSMLDDASAQERELLGAFRYSQNLAVLHTDETLMPKRRTVWSSWNYIGSPQAQDSNHCTVTYWMNRLQNLKTNRPLFVTLNAARAPRAGHLLHSETYQHPLFDAAAGRAQRQLWSLQGQRNTWFAGSYFGSGFHEDGLQAGLAAAEALGDVRRPWSVENESARIFLRPADVVAAAQAA